VAAVETRRHPEAEPGEGLERCRCCRSRLVYPLRWRRVGPDAWQLDLRCPDCGSVWRERRSTAEVRGLDRKLTEGREVLLGHLREIERIEREGEIDRFTAALAADAILPEDFAL
jgi:hypothetical protein